MTQIPATLTYRELSETVEARALRALRDSENQREYRFMWKSFYEGDLLDQPDHDLQVEVMVAMIHHGEAPRPVFLQTQPSRSLLEHLNHAYPTIWSVDWMVPLLTALNDND